VEARLCIQHMEHQPYTCTPSVNENQYHYETQIQLKSFDTTTFVALKGEIYTFLAMNCSTCHSCSCADSCAAQSGSDVAVTG
jgi:hypothetical protein